MSIQVIRDSRPVARKEYRCECCSRVIRRGERYRRQWNLWDGEPFTYIGCAHCDGLFNAKSLRQLMYDFDEGLNADMVADWEPETVAEARMKVGWKRKWTRSDGSLYPVDEASV